MSDLNIGLLFFLAMSSLGVYSVVLAGWSSENKYALIGGLRAAAQMLSYEVFMGLSLMGVVMLAGSFSLPAIVEAQRNLWFVIPQFPGFVLFLIAGLAETRRIPFDLPEAESELVAGYHSEYSGMKFGMFFVGEYMGVTLISAMIYSSFSLAAGSVPVLPGVVWFLIKTFFFIAFFVLLRASLPRPRFDQLMSWGWKVMLPLALANLLRDRRGGACVEVKMFSILRTIWYVFLHAFQKRVTVQYPEEKPYLAPRYRGRIILSRDPDGGERCVACNLCAVACPVDCIALQATEDETGRRYPEFFRINFSRCIFCGYCEEACPTYAIQLTPDFEMGEFHRKNLVYEKEDLLIDGPGKYPGYNFWRVAGVKIGGKDKGEAAHEAPPVDVRSLLP